ncbi:MAG: response regulator transcription factor [Hyphomicrobiales bacterium]|nr:MAG: response regulator transcription factor [Hyphomicrobiales bacterium]
MIRQTSVKPVPASPGPPLVLILDDDPAVRESLDSLIRSVGLATRLFGAPAELLQGTLPDVPGCMILDVRLPGISGLDFQDQLARQGIALPIVFMTGHGDIPMTVRAMKAGAVDFLSKPFRDQEMLDAVTSAIERDRQRRSATAALDEQRAAYATLTAREREVMTHVVAGLMNKQVAGVLGLSEITVKIHRGNVMRKMGVRTLADLVRAAEALGGKPAYDGRALRDPS